MSKARERQKQRRKQREMVRKAGRSLSQAAPEGNIKIPEIRIPGGRWLVLFPAAGLIFIAVVLALRFINPPDVATSPDAIWLDRSWSYIEHSNDELVKLATDLRTNDIGTIYLFTSLLSPDGTWSGLTSGNNRFTEIQPQLETLVTQLREVYPDVTLYAWLEVTTLAPDYRLDRPQIQNTIANFSQRMITELDFDGVLLDVKPIFEENEDFIQLLRTVKRQIGINTDLIVTVPPDLTPTATELNLPDFIAPGTEWTDEYKQRVALLANQIVITTYNSYQDNPVDYIEWVSYQIDSYIDVLSELNSTTTIIVSVPNFASNSEGHDTEVESLAAGLDGVQLSADLLDETNEQFLAGVAIFTDDLPDVADWTVYRQRWTR